MQYLAPAGLAKHLGASLALAMALTAGSAMAIPAVSSWTGGTPTNSVNSTNLTIGWRFTVNATYGITVNSLGWWDQNGDGLAQNHRVGVWDVLGNLLASTTVTTSNPLTGAFRYASITPLVLSSGTTYLIGGEIYSPFSDRYLNSMTSLTLDPALTFVSAARSTNSSGFAAPTTYTVANGRMGPNFDFTAISPTVQVPEPAGLALVGMGLAGLMIVTRRKSAQKAL